MALSAVTPKQLLIGGEWVATTGKTFDSINPSTGGGGRGRGLKPVAARGEHVGQAFAATRKGGTVVTGLGSAAEVGIPVPSSS
jgi:acyl-CoA reductase-like NAD-dependent aldehyde dehydrogenase